MTLKARLLVAVLLPLAAALVGFGWIALDRSQASLRVDIDSRLLLRAQVLARAVNKTNPSVMFFDMAERRAGAGFREQSRFLDGRVGWRSFKDESDLPLSSAARDLDQVNRTLLETVEHPGFGRMRMATMTVCQFVPADRALNVVGYAQTAIPLTAVEKDFQVVRHWLWTSGFVALVVAGLVAWLLLREWLSGFHRVATATRHLGTDALARARLPVPENGREVALLARDFNSVLDRLEQALALQQQFTANASHELRTPLAILRSELELALRRERNTAEYRNALENCRTEAERLSRLVENLLTLARADAGEGVAAREPVNLAALAGDLCERFRSLAAAEGVQLVCEFKEQPEVRADSIALERVFTNLIENALRHTPRGEEVRVRVRAEADGAVFEVADGGPGIPPEHLPQIFDRFYRVDKARSRQHGGGGLGLAIVKSLVEAHGGRVEVESQFGRGATFRVWLPARS
jgi:heavy metal sensor kinase